MGLSVTLKKKVTGFSLNAAWEIGNELAVLFGYSGAGKSMTLQMIAGLTKPDKGTVRSNGTVLFDSESKTDVKPQKRGFGYVFQDLALFPHMTVRKNIAYGLKGLGKSETEKRVAEIMALFSLVELRDRLPSELSGGQKQRVACARALVGRPSALLLDEPFSALDGPVRTEMREIVKNIRREFDIPVILVTHDIFEAMSMADKMIVYSNGRVRQTGPPAMILNHPADSDVERLVKAKEFYKHLSN